MPSLGPYLSSALLRLKASPTPHLSRSPFSEGRAFTDDWGRIYSPRYLLGLGGREPHVESPQGPSQLVGVQCPVALGVPAADVAKKEHEIARTVDSYWHRYPSYDHVKGKHNHEKAIVSSLSFSVFPAIGTMTENHTHARTEDSPVYRGVPLRSLGFMPRKCFWVVIYL